jgi:hypothetical protein
VKFCGGWKAPANLAGGDEGASVGDGVAVAVAVGWTCGVVNSLAGISCG